VRSAALERGPRGGAERERQQHHGRELREEPAARPEERARLEAEEMVLGRVRAEQRHDQRNAGRRHRPRPEPAAAGVEAERQQREQQQRDAVEHRMQRHRAAEHPVGEHHGEVRQVLVVAQHRESLSPVADPGVERVAARLPRIVHALDEAEVEHVVVDVRGRVAQLGLVGEGVEQARRGDEQ